MFPFPNKIMFWGVSVKFSTYLFERTQIYIFPCLRLVSSMSGIVEQLCIEFSLWLCCLRSSPHGVGCYCVWSAQDLWGKWGQRENPHCAEEAESQAKRFAPISPSLCGHPSAHCASELSTVSHGKRSRNSTSFTSSALCFLPPVSGEKFMHDVGNRSPGEKMSFLYFSYSFIPWED